MSSLEDIFSKLAMTTVTTVSRIALSHATNAAIRNVNSYITTQLPKNKPDNTKEIRTLQRQLDLKIKNLKPTIDIIARSVADGNQDLESALEMCNDLKQDIDQFATQIQTMKDPDQVKSRLKQLLENVDDAIPSLHLALRSIENKAGQQSISPSKLIQAFNVLNNPTDTKFTIQLYSLFTANQRAATAEAFTWKQELYKADLVIEKNVEKERKDDLEPTRKYKLNITESTNDGLYHEEGEEKQKLIVDIDRIDRMYYTQSGELLNIDDSKTAVLVLKVLKLGAQKKKAQEENVEVKESAPDIIKEQLQVFDWYAIGLFMDQQNDSDNDSDDEEKDEYSTAKSNTLTDVHDVPSSLLVLSNIIKLALLEVSEQMNCLNASDELIALYMK